MITKKEAFLFHHELNRLLADYRNCSNSSIRDEIYKDILLITNVIHEFKEKSLH
ncbi:hypothetical protein LZP85_06420 [Priestia flexa]|uniref:Uncharacterized protein n=1 Tax=Priestia flexa TaxID=86664 RepID=A0A1N7BEG3_9BACI|nr:MULTISPECIES: hypothetical protein [Priestia]MBN8253293.1 hypothetical protein [Priestia flexa]MBN8435717.1 hypothetical protein [Priestia flexa]MCA0968272.1 hypothetical protein [Priestia flexa]MCA1201344.1 hypothetical protein [Priestia flexa]MCG7312325.1 hypothetical protein [Priestia flexa]